MRLFLNTRVQSWWKTLFLFSRWGRDLGPSWWFLQMWSYSGSCLKAQKVSLIRGTGAPSCSRLCQRDWKQTYNLHMMQSEGSKIIAKLEVQQFHWPNGDAKLLDSKRPWLSLRMEYLHPVEATQKTLEIFVFFFTIVPGAGSQVHLSV